MMEKISFQWNEFSDHVSCAFKSFWENNDFADVTLACEDDEEVEAHRGIQTPCNIECTKWGNRYRKSGNSPPNCPQSKQESKLNRSAVPLNSLNNTDDRRVASSNDYSELLEEHDLKVRLSIGQSHKIILKGNKSKRERATVCKACGKEGQWSTIRNHIEVNYVESRVPKKCRLYLTKVFYPHFWF